MAEIDAEQLIGHVKDAEYFEVPRLFADEGKLKIPQFRATAEPIMELKVGVPQVDQLIEPFNLRVTKFMLLEVVAAVLVAAVFITLANRIKTGQRPVGVFWNLFELMLLFIRDQVARPAIGKKDSAAFVPFLWTLFFFILTCNLLGLVPWAGSPTGALAATGTLALITLCTVVGAGSLKLGPIGFWQGQVPHMDVPLLIGLFLKPMVFAIEVIGLLIKHFVLAVRLLANMMAGHVVVSVIIAFIALAWGQLAIVGVIPASLLGAVAINLLELFVAFLQAYIFTFLSALFIGMAVHPH